MYATAYSPCNSGVKGQCFSGTSSGLPAGKGVVAVDPSLYSIIAGQRLFIPGYGYATVGDVGGGYIIENLLGISRRRWIDLGYSDSELAQVGDQWGKYVTVYFLAPAPQNIPNPLN
jgi:3D (Asp-Asp-Asp) domain-containing protein